jgi:DNA-directed RNA polymerase subunit RPC12/RpoP
MAMDEKETIPYYCQNCERDVECHASVWPERLVLTTPFHRIVVQANARCPDCGAILASGREVIELY